MFKIENNEIFLTRGDSANINISIYQPDGITPYVPAANDKIIFTVKNNVINNEITLIKEFDNDLSISLSKNDTINLNFGTYYFDVRLENSTEYDTILTEGTFHVERGTANV